MAKKEIASETMYMLEHYGIELTPAIEKIFTEEQPKKNIPDFKSITTEISKDLKKEQVKVK